MSAAVNEFASTPLGHVMFPAEDSPRGLGRTLGKRVGGNPSRVRISYPPPVPHRARCRRAPPFAVGPFDVVRPGFRLRWFPGAPTARRPGSQPMIESITTSGTPRMRSTVAAVWRASWRRPSRTPASRRSRFRGVGGDMPPPLGLTEGDSDRPVSAVSGAAGTPGFPASAGRSAPGVPAPGGRACEPRRRGVGLRPGGAAALSSYDIRGSWNCATLGVGAEAASARL